jgi:tetratricopeptide (TPR) repeat protein
MEFRLYDEALAFFEISLRELGPSAATSYNMGRCHEGAGRPAQALERMKEACDIDPAFERAKLAIDKLAERKREARKG